MPIPNKVFIFSGIPEHYEVIWTFFLNLENNKRLLSRNIGRKFWISNLPQLPFLSSLAELKQPFEINETKL
jgi:hypothetical protein